MIDSNLQVFAKHVYGNRLIYPYNEEAVKVAKLLGVKSFTKDHIAALRDLGFYFEIVADPSVVL